MATYYVATNGNNSAAGSQAFPWLTLQRATQAPVAPGDLILVNDGVYSEPVGNGGIVCWISQASRSSVPGTQAQPITMRSLNQYGAQIIVPGSSTSSNSGFTVGANYWNIEGFEILGGSGQNGTSVSYAGIVLAFSSPTGVGIRNNKIHHIGRTVCSNSAFGFSGILVGQPSVPAIDCIIEDNLIYSIGRLQNGESSCSTTITAHDHGVYIDCTTNLTARRNVLYDIRSGWPFHIYPGPNTNLSIYNNTMDGTSDNFAGHILLTNNVTGNIKNNLSYQSHVAMVAYVTPGTMSVLVDHNIYYNQQSNSAAPAGVTFTNNLLSITPGFTNPSAHDYTLVAGGFAVDKGVDVGLPFSGSAPDIGYYELAQSGDTTPPATPTGLQVT